MGLIKIALRLKNKEYAYDLAMRLSEMSGGLDIEIFSQNTFLNTEQYDLILGDNDIDIYSPVSKLLNDIITMYQEKSGKYFLISRNLNLNIYSFRSDTGGAGTTAISTAFAKALTLLSLKNKVLLLCKSNQEHGNFYLDTKNHINRNPRELFYLLSNGKSVNIDSFVLKDDDYVNYIQIQNSIEPLLKVLPDISDYTHVVIDLGTNKPLEIDGKYNSVFIKNKNDFRSELVKPNKAETVILNNAENTESGNIRLTIPFSPESFLKNDDGIKILKEGTFYRTIKNYAKDLE